MSIIIQDPAGRIKVYSKGSDAVMLPRLWADETQERKRATQKAMETYSKEGLRTLVLAVRELLDDEYQEWAEEWHQATIDMEDREARMAEAMEKMETKLHLLGCTAIEDRLQRDVPDTIHYLLEAGVKVWMITGDKQETAINIGYSCKLIDEYMDVVVINVKTPEDCFEAMRTGLARVATLVESGKAVDIGMVVNGGSLDWALDDYTKDFLDLAAVCKAVIVCRATPLQKAKIVKLIKEKEKVVTLAIGDGANDVSMIQEAHVGVGIYGREGSQAARNSDYAIREFRHLKRLVMVHGRYSLIRNAACINYSFYKNAAFSLPSFWFAFFSGFSGTTLYDDFIITLFNILFTSVPPFFIALFEKDIKETTIEKFPRLNRAVQSNPYLTYYTVAVWLLSAVWHSFVVFVGGVLLFRNGDVYETGEVGGIGVLGNIISLTLILIVILKIAMETITWNVFIHLGIWCSLLVYLIVFFVESILPSVIPSMYYMVPRVFGTPNTWFFIFLVLVVCLLPEVMVKVWTRQFYPAAWHIMQEREALTGGWKRELKGPLLGADGQVLGVDDMHEKMVEMKFVSRLTGRLSRRTTGRVTGRVTGRHTRRTGHMAEPVGEEVRVTVGHEYRYLTGGAAKEDRDYA